MKYLDIIGVQNYFRDVYDITDEPVDYWKQFIPTEKFYDVLNATLENLESSEPKNIWVQGTYGTGKSHSSAVIMHMLWNGLADIEAYINLLRPQIKMRLKNFRNTKNVGLRVIEWVVLSIFLYLRQHTGQYFQPQILLIS